MKKIVLLLLLVHCLLSCATKPERVLSREEIIEVVSPQEIERIENIDIDDLNSDLIFVNVFGGFFPLINRYSVQQKIESDSSAILFATYFKGLLQSYRDLKELDELGMVEASLSEYTEYLTSIGRADLYKAQESKLLWGVINISKRENCEECIEDKFWNDSEVTVEHYEDITVRIERRVNRYSEYEEIVFIYDDEDLMIYSDENYDLWRASLEFLLENRFSFE